MAKSIAFAADASRLASLLLSYILAVCAFVAPRQPGASTAIVDRLSHSRTLSPSFLRSSDAGRAPPNRAPLRYAGMRDRRWCRTRGARAAGFARLRWPLAAPDRRT